MAKKRTPLSEQIRQAVVDSGMSHYAICKGTGIDKATMSRFMSAERGLPMKTLDRLADFLDLNITTGAGRKKTKTTRTKKAGTRGKAGKR